MAGIEILSFVLIVMLFYFSVVLALMKNVAKSIILTIRIEFKF